MKKRIVVFFAIIVVLLGTIITIIPGSQVKATAPTNLAAGKPVTASDTIQNDSFATDGDTSYYNYTGVTNGLQWLQVDLGQNYDISQINMWHYFGDGRTYHDVIVRVSKTSDFSSDVTTVFNNDTDNSAGFGVGTDTEYAETADGKSIVFNKINARYVRFYLNGSNFNIYNQYVEVEVWDAPLNGLVGQYYSDKSLSTYVWTRTDPNIDFNWTAGSPDPSLGSDNFSIRWLGKIEPKYSETYTFYANTDEGVKLWINGVQIINSWVDGVSERTSSTINLTAGQKYDIKMEYYENGGNAQAHLSWSSASQAKQVVPSTCLFPATCVNEITSSSPNGTYKTGDDIPITVGFSDVVNVTGTPQLLLNTGRTVNYASGSGTDTLTFNYTVQSGDNTPDLDYSNTNALALNGGTIKDTDGSNAVLTLPVSGGTDSLGANKDIVIDAVAPVVNNVSSTTSNGSYKAGAVIAVTMQFSKNVTVTGTPQLSLNTGRTVNYSSGSGTNTLTFNYTVQAGDTTTDLNYVNTSSLTLNGGTIKDSVGNNATLTLPVTGGAGSLGTNKDIVIDTTAPTVNSVSSTNSNGTYKQGDSIAVTVTFTENVTVTGTPQLALNTGKTVNYSSGSGTNTLTFNYIVQAGDSTGDLNYVNTSSLTFNGGSIKDTTGNDAALTLPATGGAGSLGTNKNIVVDGVAPYVTNVTSSSGNGSYKSGVVIPITITFNENVTVSGTPQLTLNTGRTIDYSSGSGTNILTFNYTVQAGDTTTDLNYVNTGSLTFNGGTIRDAAGNDAALTLPATGGAGSLGTNKDIVIDTTAPTVNGVSSSNGNGTYKLGNMIAVTVNFSENVTVTGTPQITLNTGRTVDYSSGSGTSTLTFNYTIQTGDTAGDLNYVDTASLILNGGTINDAAGNNATLTLPATGGAGSLGTNMDIIVDGVVPTVQNVTSTTADGSYKSGAVIAVKVVFNENVNVTGTPQLALNTGRTVDYSGGTGTNTLTFNYTVQAGDTTTDLNYVNTGSLTFNSGTIRDAAGNDAALTLPAVNGAGSLGTNKNINIDTTAPNVNGVSSSNGNGTYKLGDSIAVTVAFSENVTVSGTPQLALNSGRTINYSSGSGTGTLIFNYTVQAGDSAADLDYTNTGSLTLNGGSIKDAALNDAVTTLPAPGDTGSLGDNKNIAVDGIVPYVTNVTATNGDGSYKAGAVIGITITLSENVNVTGTPQLTLNTGSTVDYSGGSGSNTLTFNYTIQAGESASDLNYVNTGSLTFNGGTIKDAAGNDAGLTLPATGGAGALGTNKDIVVDTTAPTVSNVTATNGNGTYKLGDHITITISLTENVIVTGTPQLALNTGRTADYNGGSGTNTLSFDYTVQAGDSAADLNYVNTGSLALNGGTMKDAAGNDVVLTLPATGGAGSLGTNKDIKIDGVVPTVTSVSSSSGNGTYKAGDTVTVTVTFSENVDVTGTPQLALNTGRTINYSGGTGTSVLSFNYTIQAGDNTTDLDYVNTGSLTLNSGTIKDTAGNDAVLTLPAIGGAGSLGVNKDIIIDGLAPTVSNVTSTNNNGTYKTGDTIAITVAFPENVFITGTPQLALNTGRTINYSSGSGSSTLTFNYTVQTNDSAADLNYTDTASLTLNGGTIKDAAGNNATLTLPATGGVGSLGTNKDITVDAIAPYITGVTSTDPDGTYTAGQTITITMTFNENVSVTGTPQLALNTGRNAVYASGSGSSTLTFTYTIQSGDVSPDLDYAATTSLNLNGGTIKDIVGNNGVLTLPNPGDPNSIGGSKAIVIDAGTSGIIDGSVNNPPANVNLTVEGNNDWAHWGLTDENSFEHKDGVAQQISNYTILGAGTVGAMTGSTTACSWTDGTPTLNTVNTSSGIYTAGQNKGFSFTVNAGTQQKTLRVYVGARNAKGKFEAVLSDGSAPNYTDYIDSPGGDTYKVYTLTFKSQTPGQTLTINYTVDTDYNTPNGNVILQAAALISPVVTKVTSTTPDGIYKQGTVIPITVKFSDTVTVTGTPQLTLNTGRTIDYTGGSGTDTLTFNYTVQAGDNSADLGYVSVDSLQLNSGTIKDSGDNDVNLLLPDNSWTNSLTGSKNIAIDTTAPSLTGVTSSKGNGNYKLGDVIDIRVTFDDVVYVSGTPQLTLNTGSVVDYASGSGSNTLIFNYTIQAGDNTADLNYTATNSLSLNGGSIQDAAGNDAGITLPDPSAAGSLGTNKDIAVDGIIPGIDNVTSDKANGTYKVGDIIDIKVVLSENVNVTGTPQIILNTGRTVNYSSGSGSNTLIFNYTVQSGDNIGDLDYFDTVSLILNGGSISDTAGNNAVLTLAATGGAGSLGGNKNIVIDGVVPDVNNVTSDDANGTYKVGDTISIKVVFSENVTVTGTPQLGLNTGRIIDYTSGSGSNTLVFDYTVQAGDSISDLNYVTINSFSLNGGSIKDAALNDAVITLPATGGAGSLGTNKNIAVDGIIPTIDNVTSNTSNGIYKAGDVIDIRIHFSENVTVTGTPQITLNTGSTVDYSGGSGSSTLVFNYTVQAGDSIADLNYTAVNALVLNGGSITDAALNNANITLPATGGAGSLGTNKDIAIDTAAPGVTGITSNKANGTYKVGDVIDIRVSFDEAVMVSGTPRLLLNTGRTIDYVGGSGSSTLVFNYTVQVGDQALDLDYNAADSLTLNGGSIQDAAGNDGNLTLPAPGGVNSLGSNKNMVIDGIAPTVINITSTTGNGAYKAGDVIVITVQFDSTVNVTGTPQLLLNTGRTINYNSGSGTDTLAFNYTVQNGDTIGDLDYLASDSLSLNSGTIKDTAGNNADITIPVAGGAGSLGFNKNISIDTTVPTVNNITSDDANGTYKVGDTISIKVVFAENVTVTGTPQLGLNTGRIIDYTSGSGSNTLVFDYTVQAGDSISDLNYVTINSLSLNGGSIKDAALNDAVITLPATGGTGSLGTNKNIAVDGIIPTIDNVTSNTSNGIYKAGDVIDIRIHFSENVTVTGTPQITLNTGSTVDYSGGSGSSTLVFNYTVQAGDSISDLNYTAVNALVLNGGSITDAALNDANITLPATGGAGSLGTNKDIAIDTAAPGVTGITSNKANGTYKVGDVIDIRVSLDEAVMVSGTPQLLLNTGRNIDYVSGSGSSTLVFTYTVQVGDQALDLDYNAADSLTLNGGSIQDAAGNNSNLILPAPGGANSLGSNKNIVIDGIAPTVIDVTSTNGNGTCKAGDVIAITVQFDSTVNVTGTPQLLLNTGRTVNYNSGSGTDTLVFNYTVQQGDDVPDLDYMAVDSFQLNGGTIRDAAVNNADLTLPAAGGAGSLGGNKDITLDGVIPTVVAVTSDNSNGDYSQGDIIAIKVVFSKAVDVTGTPQITLNTGRTVDYTSGNGTNTLIFTYTIQSGDNAADLDYAQTTSLSGTIKDSALNNADLTLPAPGGAGSLGGNKDILVDALNPFVTNVTSDKANGTYGVGEVIDIKVVFNEAVNVTGTPQLALNSGRSINYQSGSGTDTLIFRYTVGAGDTSSDLNYAETNSLTLNGGTVKDNVDNNAVLTLPATGGAGSLGTNKAIVISTVQPPVNPPVIPPVLPPVQPPVTPVPSVLYVTSDKADGVYKAGTVIDIKVAFSGSVNVTGTPSLHLNTEKQADYLMGSGTDMLTFRYIVAEEDSTPDLNYTSTGALNLNGGTLKDKDKNDAVLILPDTNSSNSLGGRKNITIDTWAPSVRDVSSYRSGNSIVIKVSFDEKVNVTGIPQVRFNSGKIADYGTGSGSETLIFYYVIPDGDFTRIVSSLKSDALILNAATIKDDAGNDALVAVPEIDDDGILADDTNKDDGAGNEDVLKPGTTIDLKVKFDDVVVVSGTPQIVLEGGKHAVYAGGSGTDTLTFKYVVKEGDTGDVFKDLVNEDINITGGKISSLSGIDVKNVVEVNTEKNIEEATGFKTTVSVSGGKIRINWTIGDKKDLAGFYVYRGTKPGKETRVLLTKTMLKNTIMEYADATAKKGVQYYYVCKAVYNGKKPVVLSNEVKSMVNKDVITLTIGNAYMFVNGKKVEIDPGRNTKPIIIDNRSLLPLRSVVEAMGGQVLWDEKVKKATFKMNGKTISMWVGKRTVYVNSAKKTIDVTPVIKNSRTMMPIRFIAENFGCEVGWDDKMKKITISY